MRTLLAIALPVGGAVCLAADLARGRPARAALLAPPRALALGFLGILGYHAALFFAFTLAPRVPVNLVNYCWPLVLVLLGGWVEGGLRPRALVGAVAGFGGAALAVCSGDGAGFETRHLAGYACAAFAAVAWPVFSVLLPRVPGAQGRMAGFCLWSGLAAAALVPLTGGSPVPDTATLAAAVYIGVGPLGLAFAAWEAALARTSAQSLGALSYVTPVASTLLLSCALARPLGLPLALALALVVGGAALGASGRPRPA